jgi:hypothetical protein
MVKWKRIPTANVKTPIQESVKCVIPEFHVIFKKEKRELFIMPM